METLVAACPVCEAEIPLGDTTEESEILHCWDCSSRLVAIWVEQRTIALSQAPTIEDWN